MSNPFKSSSNRFNLLDERNSSSPFENKRKKEKEEKQDKVAEQRENRFLRNYDKNKGTKNIISNANNEKKEVNLEQNFEELFPEMIKNKPASSKESIKLDFKSLVNKIEVEEPIIETTFIKPGSVVLKYENNKIVSQRGQLTKWEKQKEIETFYELSSHYIMTNAIYKMEELWDLYERVYDSINGEGTYNEKFRIEPIYNSDYEEDDEDEDEDEDIEHESYYSNEY
jgi:hypothetical protein